MTESAALNSFFNSFGIPAFPDTAVPDGQNYPYITYEAHMDMWGGEPISMVVQLYYYTESEAEPNAKAREIEKRLGIGGVTVPSDNGIIWITRGVPFCQSLLDATDKTIKRRYLLVNAEFLTGG